MTYPNGPYGQPDPAQPPSSPPNYGPPAYGEQYGPPQYGPPAYGEQYVPPAYGVQYAPNPYAAAQYQLTGFENLPGKPPRSGRTKGLIAASVAVVVAAAAAVSFLAFRDQGASGGADTAQNAVQSIVTDLGKSDILGVLDDLPPAERNAIRDSFLDQVKQLKRLQVLQSDADPDKVVGVSVQSTALTFGTDDVINDRVRVVTLTGGTITVNADADAIPYTKKFLDAAFPHGAPSGRSTNSVDIGAEVKDSGKPVRIAVQKVNGKWYPSIVYTIVDNVNQDDGNADPNTNDAIPATGAGSAEDAVRTLLNAALDSDPAAAIAILDPNDSAALHDYGRLLFQRTSRGSRSATTVDNIDFTTTRVTGGTRVSLKSITVTQDDDQVTLTISGSCVKIDSTGKTQQYCSDRLFTELDKRDYTLTNEQKSALTHLLESVPKIGIVATQANGKWFVSALRTYGDVGNALLGGLGNNDLIELIELAGQHR